MFKFNMKYTPSQFMSSSAKNKDLKAIQDYNIVNLGNSQNIKRGKKNSIKSKKGDIKEARWKVEFAKIREEKIRLKYPQA